MNSRGFVCSDAAADVECTTADHQAVNVTKAEPTPRTKRAPPLTRSKFLKKDVNALLSRALRAGDIETACYMSAELALTNRGELEEACASVIDAFASEVAPYLNAASFVYFSGRMSSALEAATSEDLPARSQSSRTKSSSIRRKKNGESAGGVRTGEQEDDDFSSDLSEEDGGPGRKNDVRPPNASTLPSDTVRQGLCDLVVRVCQAFQETAPARAREKGGAQLDGVSPPTSINDTISTITESVLSPRKVLEDHARHLGNGEISKLESKIRALFNPHDFPEEVLWVLASVYLLASGAAVNECVRLVRCVIVDRTEAVLPLNCAVPAIATEEFAGLSTIQKKDVAWYLWRMCVVVSPKGDCRKLTLGLLRLYKHRIRKKSRATRVPLLCRGFEHVIRLVNGLDARQEQEGSTTASPSSCPYRDEGEMREAFKAFDAQCDRAVKNVGIVYAELVDDADDADDEGPLKNTTRDGEREREKGERESGAGNDSATWKRRFGGSVNKIVRR